jgi:pilus assembly protein CpaF
MTAVYESLRRDALDRIQRNEVDPSDRSAVTTLVRHLVDGYQLAATSGSGRAPLHDPSSMVERLGRSILDFGPLTPFVDGTLVYEELIIHGDQVSYIDAEGRLVAHSDPISEDEVVHVVDKLLAAVGASVDEHRPMIQAQVLGGSGRLGVVVPPIADRIDVTLRRYLTKRETFDEMIGWDAISPAAATLLATMMRLPTGVLVTGQPGAGKTSLLNAMLRSAPSSLRVIACEDTPELSVDHLHAARWKTRAPGADGSGEVTLRDLVRLSLGMRPDLIVVGETRGGEAYELTRAGNAAVMAGPNVAVDQVRHVFSSIIDLVVSVAKEPVTATRDGSGGRRQVMEIASVPRLSGSEVEFSVEPIFLREDFGAPLCWTGTPLPHELSHRLDAVLRPLGLVAADVLEGRTSSLLSGVGGA